MENQKYPIGLQSFSEVRGGKYVYIDKTEGVYEMVKEKKYVFLSRPRRFGKSLLLNTLKSFYQGRKDLFEGLFIYDKIEFAEHPIIHISFDKLDYTTVDLAELIKDELRRIAASYQIVLEGNRLKSLFYELCEKLHEKMGRKVVILIDEYDHPILHYLEKENYDKAEEMRETIREFYSVIKSLDDHIQFFFLTGISRFTKVALFSVLNNIDDISFQEKFSTICGYTQEELVTYFPQRIAEIAQKHKLSYNDCLEKIKVMYNGYSWDGVHSVYAPFSTLRFMSEMAFKSHWFTTGTPHFLLKLLSPKLQYKVEDIWVQDTFFDTYDIRKLSPINLMLQTGYLTIKQNSNSGRYLLGFPNQEVRNAFLQFLGGEYTFQGHNEMNNWVYDFVDVLQNQEIDKIPKMIHNLFSDIPYHLFKNNHENFYHAITFIALKLVGVHILCEQSKKDGRIDAVIHTDKTIYIFEFKINSTASAAIQQAKDRNYAESYLHLGKQVLICGVSFSQESKGVEDWGYEIMNN